MKVKRTLNRASLPKAIEDAVKRGYSEEDATRILTAYVDSRFEDSPPAQGRVFMNNEEFLDYLESMEHQELDFGTHSDPGDEHPPERIERVEMTIRPQGEEIVR